MEMERILDRRNKKYLFIKATTTLHRNQNAYQKGKSLALKNVLQGIAKVFNQQEICIRIIMDVEGAFDNIKYETSIEGHETKKVDSQTIKWMELMLRNRTLYSNLSNETKINLKRLSSMKGFVPSR